MRHRFDGIRRFDDVLPCLESLAEYRLGIVSNGNSEPDRCGLSGRVAFAVFADDHGARKPNRRLFESAVRLADCRPDEILHVGDSLAEDVAGARQVGIRTAWINRARVPNTTGVRPDFELHWLADLPLLCLELGAASA